MSTLKRSVRRFASIALCAGSLAVGVPLISEAQTNPGFSFVWGDGPSQKQQLGYVLSYGTPRHLSDRWRLKIKRQSVAIDRINITYPDYFDGKFKAKKIELRHAPKSRLFNLKKGKNIPVDSVTIDPDGGVIEIIPTEVIPADTPIEVVASNVRNPKSGGTYFFNCRISSPGDVGLMRYVGAWIVSIYRN
ncbi:DUF2808 domain-containing protein [Acaryochloris marina]|uniref:DUF2808 domain-containing protein n=1 Tax=Acaryochloris marina (strain MBIC 11017) TaxID=329726 RepID=B0C138_ACAM1|nr:DUF2808 domain-containing protein [Acaryochloris marina]ABW28436.1 conserved hypothetical protein [Acaryochloris marina MBIC11017]BDM77438.1 hypothetical protein AM10699_03120 [Acaryochloris marina MBIC10699]